MTGLPPSPPLEQFAARLGEEFSLRDPAGNQAKIKLQSATSLGFNRPREQGGLESFSLLFLAPANLRVPQGTFTFVHPQLGAHDFFLVPLGPDASGLRLEVIFNFN